MMNDLFTHGLSGKTGMSMTCHHRANPQFPDASEAPILAQAGPSFINEGKSVFFNAESYF